MLNISVVLPDPEANGVYLPFAKAQARAFAAQWQGGYISRVLVVDEARIMIEMMRPDVARVTITSILPYMESGIFELGSTAISNEATYRPATIKFTPFVALLSQTLPNTNGRKIEDGYETWTPAGCPKDKLKSIRIFQPDTTFERVEPTYCEPNKIMQRKLLLDYFPPSVFTGKLKLMMQAVYGSKRDDLVVGFSRELRGQLYMRTGSAEADGSGPMTELKYGYPTSGLLAVGKGLYILVSVATDGVTWRKMNPRNDLAQRGGGEKEAYALAQLVPSATATVIGFSGGVPEGAPIAYGWHFNEGGMEAHAAFVTSATVNGIRVQALDQAAATIGGLRCTLYKLAFTWNHDTQKLTCALSAVESGLHIPLLQDKIFVPSSNLDGMTMVAPNSPPPWDCYTSARAPVYCYYRGDNLVVVRARNSDYSIIPAQDQLQSIYDFALERYGIFNPADVRASGFFLFGQSFVSLPAYAFFAARPKGVNFASHGFESDELTMLGENKSWEGQSSTMEVSVGPSSRPPESTYYIDTGISADTAVLAYNAYYIATGLTRGASYKTETTQKDVTDLNNHVLVVPFGDASAVIIGQQAWRSSTPVSLNEFMYSNNNVYKIADGDLAFGTCTNLTNTWYLAPGVPSGIRVSGGLRPVFFPSPTILWAARAASAPEDRVGRPKNVALNTMQIKLSVACAAGVETVGTFTADNDSDVYYNFYDRPYASLFGCSASEPIYRRVMTVRSSWSGAARHDSLLPDNSPTQTGYLGGWPENADIPVGWA